MLLHTEWLLSTNSKDEVGDQHERLAEVVYQILKMFRHTAHRHRHAA